MEGKRDGGRDEEREGKRGREDGHPICDTWLRPCVCHNVDLHLNGSKYLLNHTIVSHVILHRLPNSIQIE